MSQKIIFKDSNSFSTASYKLIGILVVFLLVSIFIAMTGSFIPMAFLVTLIYLLIKRTRVTEIDESTNEIIQYQSILGLKIPLTFNKIDHSQLKYVFLKFRIQTTVRTLSTINIPTRFKVEEYYIDLKIKNQKKPIRIMVLFDYAETLEEASYLSKVWNIPLVNHIELRDKKAEQKRLERQKRGLR